MTQWYPDSGDVYVGPGASASPEDHAIPIQAAQPVAPPPETPAPAPPVPVGGCMKDIDCKGDRICRDGSCVDPR